MPDFSHLVVHCKKHPYDVYVGRPSVFGNPFSCKPKSVAEIKVNTVEDAVACHEAWLETQPELVAQIKRELKDKVLGCWCAPGKPCHAQTLASLANE